MKQAFDDLDNAVADLIGELMKIPLWLIKLVMRLQGYKLSQPEDRAMIHSEPDHKTVKG